MLSKDLRRRTFFGSLSMHFSRGFPYSPSGIESQDLEAEHPVKNQCSCSENMLKDLATLKGYMLLDSLTSFLNAVAFHVPFDGYITIPTILHCSRRKSMSDSIDIKNTQRKPICHAKEHTLFESGGLYTVDELLQNIAHAGREKNVCSIKFYFMLAQERRRYLCDAICVGNPEHNLVYHTIVEVIKQKCREIFEPKFAISKIWVGRNSRNVLDIERSHRDNIWRFDIVVVVTQQSTERNSRSLWGFDVLLVSANECNSEAIGLLPYELHDSTKPTMRVNENDLSDLFNNHSNISLINVSNVRSRGFNTSSYRIEKTPTLVIYCHVKGVIPIGERVFPEKVSGFEVDVREGTCSLAVRGLRMSENVHADDCAKLGTLGGFVDLQNSPGKAFLTCAHVVLPTNVLQNQLASEYVRRREIIRVFDRENNEIGKITKAVFDAGQPANVSVDAALVEITDRHPSDGCFSDVYSENQLNEAGFSVQHVPHFSNGQMEKISNFNFRKQVIKVGASSGLTLGSLKMGRSCANIIDDCGVKIDNSFVVRYFGQLEVLPRIDPTHPSDSRQAFASSGDSGALVFAIHNENPIVLKCIGIVVAKTSYGSCLMTPIDKVLDALDLPYNCLSKFSIPSNNQDSDSENLRSMFTIITQRLTDMHSTMATKSDVESLKNDLQNFNDRLTIAESNIRGERITIETEV
ncbi:uncharacterized protein LOC125661672 isoform X2 [Ostrea edulis]|nr:uncharacterized protein LOC125661672 isoform X2 [Ostrea edulis]